MNKRPPAVIDSAGRPVPLGARLGQGGEGAVYEVKDKKETVAKVYHRALSANRAAKITAMTTISNQNVIQLSAWPLDLLKDRSGSPI